MEVGILRHVIIALNISILIKPEMINNFFQKNKL